MMNLRKTTPPPVTADPPPTARAFLPRTRRTFAHLHQLRQAEMRLRAALVEQPDVDEAATHATIAHIRDESQPR